MTRISLEHFVVTFNFQRHIFGILRKNFTTVVKNSKKIGQNAQNGTILCMSTCQLPPAKQLCQPDLHGNGSFGQNSGHHDLSFP